MIDTANFRVGRSVSDLILELKTGKLATFLIDSPSPSRQSRLVSAALEISSVYNVEVDLEVKVNFGRRPKRLDLAFTHMSTLIVGGMASSGNLVSELARISTCAESVRDEVTRLKKNLITIGYVITLDKSEKLTNAQHQRYHGKEIYFGSVDKLARVLKQ